MMSLVRLMAMALALAGTSLSFHPSASARNQYEDRALVKTPLLKNQKEPDLQVGCGDGNIHEADLKKNRIPSRRKRSYVPWSGQASYSTPYQSINAWKPSVYPIERPYFVPIYGAAGRPPIYFPPQPLRLNPGVPKDNPNKFHGPQYLPPDDIESTTMFIGFKYGDDKPVDDDRPIWDLGDNELTTSRPSSNIIPTRAPPPPGGTGLPPLIHSPINGGDSSSGSKVNDLLPPKEVYSTKAPQQAYPTRPRPTRPRPTRPRPTTVAPPGPNEPTRCVWAIISCCSSGRQINYDCFEERGCFGAFWDNNPCDSEFAKSAIAAALNYYN